MLFQEHLSIFLNDLTEHGNIHRFQGKGHQILGGFGDAAHGIDVAQGIGGAIWPNE
jgi:hypothetical protein